MVKGFYGENLDIVMLKEIKREICNRMFVGNIWMIRNKVWASLPGCGALIIWDSKKLTSEEVVGTWFFWPSSGYGFKNTILRKDFWLELLHLFGFLPKSVFKIKFESHSI